ncbi:hydroxypyruvate isomerase family protein [Microlunatus soli]|uniref:Hydroxypyruvate isomerase n=1 Tax=Microlunatus soli TaxID=630515 RepID=A0A1H1XTH3_9ACTN|nr:TIM barrel protein [Microlunatus soli]SDT12554.1 hydroxypyruvate isomerase [Microlunatus soli]
MEYGGYELSANVSLLFAEIPYLERFSAAHAAGFGAVESWWPFTTAEPGVEQIDELLAAIEAADVRLTGLNFYAGDMPAGERGVACRPERHGELRASIAPLLRIAETTGCRHFNLLYGQLATDSPADRQHRAAAEAIEWCAAAVAPIGGTVLIEPLAEGLNGAYPLLTDADVLALLDGPLAGVPNAALLLDTFHLATNGIDPADAAVRAAERIGHVQLADAPGRGEPGSGDLDWPAVIAGLDRAGYRGLLGCEYKPTGPTAESFGWLQDTAPTR